MKKCWIDKYLELSPRERKRRNVGRKGMEQVKYAPRKNFTFHETRLYLVKNNIINLSQLRKREHLAECPSYHFVRKYWGSFEGYRKSIGINSTKMAQPTDMQILKTLAEYQHIRTLKQYLEYRKIEPCLFVSRREIRKRFVCWKNCRRLADGLNSNSIIERWMLFEQELGRTPTKEEAVAHGIELMNIKASYKEFKQFVWMLKNPRKFIKRATA